jgi:hypothetical protein
MSVLRRCAPTTVVIKDWEQVPAGPSHYPQQAACLTGVGTVGPTPPAAAENCPPAKSLMRWQSVSHRTGEVGEGPMDNAQPVTKLPNSKVA